MSQIMEKTFASIPKLLTQSLIGGGGSKTQQRQMPAMDVQNFMRIVHRARSKTHESHIVSSELSNIQLKLKQTDLLSCPAVVRSCFTKVLFCHLLGYNVNFVAIHAVNLAQQGRGFDKRLGYLMSCLLLSPHHEMVMLMIATLLRDIKSSNMGDNCVALKVAGELVDEETIPTILPEVIKKFSHQNDLVHEKAIHCFGAFYRRSPELLRSEIGRLNVFLTSRDPGILTAVINVFVTLTSENPTQFIGLGSSFLHILDQINNRGFGSSYYYHMIPLPWLQICLLKVIGNIGHVDPHLSANVCPLLKNLIEKTKVSVPISLAILVESILTATKIYPNEALLHLCSRCIMKLLASDSSEDMRYQGLGLLIALSRKKPSIVSQHQVAVVECLTNDDPAIQSRTTLLLHAMANRANVKAICSKLFEQLEKTKDCSFKQDILMMINDLAERFSPDIDWYISINFRILSYELPQLTQDKVTNMVLRKIEQISGSGQLIDEASVNNLTKTLFSVVERQNYMLAEFPLAIQLFGILAPILQEEFSSERFLDVVAKCLSNSVDNNSVINKIVTVYSPDHFGERNKLNDFSDKTLIKLKSQCVMTVTRMVLCQRIQPSSVLQWLEAINYNMTIRNLFLRNDLDDLEYLARNPQDLKMKSAIFFQDNLDIDFSLSFLDSLVIEDMLKDNECFKPSYITKPEIPLLQSSTSSLDILDSKDADSIMGESQSSQTVRKLPSKWRDDDDDDEGDDVVEDEWNVSSGNEGSERFVFISSGDKQLEELNRKKKAAEELFAGLDESNFDGSDFSMSHSSPSDSVSSPQTKRGKTIWDDDDDDDNTESNNQDKKHGSIFNVGNIGINPFGISKKSKGKSMPWTDNFVEDNSSSNMGDMGTPVKPLGSLNNNNNNEFDDFMYASPSEGQSPSLYHSETLLSDKPWSDHRDGLSMAQEAIPATYPNTTTDQSFAFSLDGLSGSTVDALTDSDPDAGES